MEVGATFNFTEKDNWALIEEVRERPILWDPAHAEHLKTNKVTENWMQVAESFGLERKISGKFWVCAIFTWSFSNEVSQ